MRTIWIENAQLETALERNEAYWRGELHDFPIIWVYASDAKPGEPLPPPYKEDAMWTNPDYAVAAAENRLSRTHFAGDALPTYDPWIGPDQFAGWLGAELTLRPNEYTSWVRPFVEDWDTHPEFSIDPDNRWWQLYLALLKRSVEAGRDKWVTCFPDLHTGIDALSAIRGPQNLLVDLLANPDTVLRAMGQMSALWKKVVDLVSARVLPAGQGTSNWTGGWSEKRFLCIGQNDFSYMISPEMFDTFCLEDTRTCIEHVDYALYHLDGEGALRHLPRILEIQSLHTVQWIHGDGKPPHSQWLHVLQQIQDAGKSVQVWYNRHYTSHVVDIFYEIETLCRSLDIGRLFIGVEMASADAAEAVAAHTRKICT